MSPDSYFGSMRLDNPQSMNRCSNVGNDPINFADPTGLDCAYIDDSGTAVESIDTHSSADECGASSGFWVNGTVVGGFWFADSNNIILIGKLADETYTGAFDMPSNASGTVNESQQVTFQCQYEAAGNWHDSWSIAVEFIGVADSTANWIHWFTGPGLADCSSSVDMMQRVSDGLGHFTPIPKRCR